MRALAWMLAAAVFVASGCAAEVSVGSRSAGLAGEEAAGETHPDAPVIAESVGAVDLVPAPELRVRARRRLDLDQLSAAIRRATGGIGWDEGGDGDHFEALAATLGKPDYLEITQEDLSPSALFHKFLDDAARDVCARLVEAELAGAAATLMVEAAATDIWDEAPEAVEANLRRLLLRYHGKALDQGAPELAPWRWLFQTVGHGSEEPTTAWRAVCVALITHPDFYSY